MIIGSLFHKADFSVPVIFVPLALILAWAGFQLTPAGILTPNEEFGYSSDYWEKKLQVESNSSFPIESVRISQKMVSISPFESQVMLGRMLIALTTGVSVCILFHSLKLRLFLLWCMLLNVAGVGLFGMFQKSEWNGKLYWIYSIPANALSFGPFVNRNNAAGYLTLGLAVGIGLCTYHFFSTTSLGVRFSKDLRPNSESLNVSDTLRIFASSLSVPVIASGLFTIAIYTSILATESRGGVIAATLAVILALIMIMKKLNVQILVWGIGGLIAVIILAGTLWMMLPEKEIFERIKQLNYETVSKDARWKNWADAKECFKDHWRFGTGLKTYQFATLPYQSFYNRYWFYYAENQYLHLAIELGLPGIILMICVCGIIGWVVLTRMIDYLDLNAVDFMLLLILLVFSVTQGIQAIFDYGLFRLSNMMSASTVLFAAMMTIKLDFIIPLEDRDHSPSFWPYIYRKFLLITLFVTLIPVVVVLRDQAVSDRYITRFNEKSTVIKSKTEVTESIKTALIESKDLKSNNPEYHLYRATALLQMLMEEWKKDLLDLGYPAKLISEYNRQIKQPYFLHRALLDLKNYGGKANLEKVLQGERYRRWLEPAKFHLQQAVLLRPLDSRNMLLVCALDPALNTPKIDRLVRLKTTVSLRPSDPYTTYHIGLMAYNEDDFFMNRIFWRQTLLLSEESLPVIMQYSLNRYSLAYILNDLLPDDPAMMLRICEMGQIPTLTKEVKSVIARHVIDRLSDEQNVIEDRKFLVAKAIYYKDDLNGALLKLESILETEPWHKEARLLCIEVLLQQKKYSKAYTIAEKGRAYIHAKTLYPILDKINTLQKYQ